MRGSRTALVAELHRLDAATAHLDAPFAIVDMAAFRANAAAMASRAAGKPIRLASKSVRCRSLIELALGMTGFRGILAFTLPEALWLAATGTSDDIVVAYPTADRRALAALAGQPAASVNGGGTGSLAATAAEPAVTEIGAGSGLYHPTLFDAYHGFTGTPAAMFALPVVRRPGPGVVTALGGGYLASGPGTASRMPSPYLPAGLRLDKEEGAGEVQTPLIGPAADQLTIGDTAWFRHAKAGELCERFSELHLVDGDAVVATVPTYRGEGLTFA